MDDLGQVNTAKICLYILLLELKYILHGPRGLSLM